MQRDLIRTIWIFTFIIIVLGLITLYSASFQNSRVSQKVFYDQLVCAVFGLGIMYILSNSDYRKFYDIAYILYGINLLLLIIVLLGGRSALGARRWLEIGDFSFQPSELMKISLIFALGRYLTNRRPKLSFDLASRAQNFWHDLILPFLMTAIPMFLIFKQPDLGTALLIFIMFLVILFVSELELRYFVSFLILLLGALPLGWHILRSYQKDRLLVFLNPNVDPLGAGYTIIQSKIAIGSGQFLGKGWLSGTQNQLNFLPERHTDFIFSVIGEEWGLMGSLFLVFCYFVLIYCGINIAQQVKDKFGTLVSFGMVSMLALQVIINIGMTMGLFPVVGLTLPLISYGRTSFLIFMIMLGFLLNLSKRRMVF